MTEHTDEHKRWATRLNVTPELIATAEQITGRTVADLMAQPPVSESQMEQDATALGSAMAHHGVLHLQELADAMNPTDDDYDDLQAVLQRSIPILLQDNDNQPPSDPTP